MSLTKDNLREAIDIYKSHVVDPKISDIVKSFIFQIIYFISLFSFAIFANLNPNFNSVVGSIGMSGLSVQGNYKAAQEAVNKFLKDKRYLEITVSDLKIDLYLCQEDDESCLKELENKIRKYVEKAKE